MNGRKAKLLNEAAKEAYEIGAESPAWKYPVGVLLNILRCLVFIKPKRITCVKNIPFKKFKRKLKENYQWRKSKNLKSRF